METHLRAGMAVFNAGAFHAAHDAWEDRWLELESGTDDERFLHGLIQYTAAVYHAYNRNWGGATGLAGSAGEYLSGLPGGFRGVNVGPIRGYLSVLAADPEVIERRRAPSLTLDGSAVTATDLDFEATAIAAECLAEKHGDEELIERGVEFARKDLDGTEPLRGETDTPFVPLVFDYVREPENRAIIVQRLESHVDRRVAREEDVAGLFEERE